VVLTEGEFNRYYMRGLCKYAIDNNIGKLEVYRAKHVDNPRAESEMKIGERICANQLLNDLRVNKTGTELGLPPGPNSGLSIRLPM